MIRPFRPSRRPAPALRARSKTMVLLTGWLAGANTLLAQIPAFPGAEGAGAFAIGGRLGDVYHVTNTNASGTGSLAYGLTTGVPAAGRTIVFDVSGYAHIAKELRVTAAKITIAGQTAPGDGFGLKDGTFRVSSDEFVVRHLRFRNGESADSVDLDSGSLNSIFDHCDVMFSTDENMSSFGSPPENLTFQWGLNAWGLESHSCGGLWDQNHATCHHSLWAHNHTRNPKARPSLLDWSNNVTFDWDIGFILADSQTPANWNANVVGNYFIAGTSGKTKALEKGSRDRNGAWNFHVWLSNNRFDGNMNGQVDGTDTGYGMVSGDVEHLTAPLVNTGKPVTVDDPLTAYKKVISAAGPLRLEADVAKPLRDEVAALLITETVNQTHHHVSSVAGTGLGNGGFGTLASQAAPTDTDRDGMPDFWETALGWNAATDDHTTLMANDGTLITGTTFFPAATVKGYTRLEEYLHWLAIPHATVQRNTTTDPTAIDIDLRKFTSGFTVTPVFTLTGVVGGAATQSGTGGYLVRFVPTVNTFGRARFEFKVQDAAGSQWTQTFGILVSASSLPRDLSWKGNGSTNVWDGVTLNFQRNATGTTFGPGDTVTFDDTGSKAPAVSIPANVAPATVTVNAAGNYTFSGAGGIGSTGALLKRGTGSLTFTNTVANGFTGVTLDEGAIVMNNATALGTGALDLRGGALTLGGSLGNALSIKGTVGLTTGGNTLSGTWSGDGDLNANMGNNTFSVSGDMSAFSGTIKLGTSTGFFRFNGSTGSSLAGWDLGTSTARLINRNGGATFNVGSLRGGVNTTLGAASAADATSTYNIGGNNESTTFDGKILDGGNSLRALSVTKVGTGALTLTGASSYLGATLVSAGELIVNGSLSTTPVTVASGAKLRGNGSLTGSLTMEAGSQLSPGAATGLVGTLTLGSVGLNLQGGSLSYQLSNSPAGANDKVVMSGGALNLSGTNTLALSLSDGVLGAGTYDLISGGTATVGTAANVSATFPTGGRQTFALAVPAGNIQVVVTGNAGNLTWVGNQNAATWDLTTTANFTGATPGTFYNLDAVTFDDTSTNRNVVLTGSLSPRSTTVNTTAGYTFGGTGALAGGSLTKMGNGSLTIANANSWAGNTIISGGVIQLGSAIPSLNAVPNNSGLGTSVVTLQGGALFMQETSNLNTGVGTLPNDLIVATTGTLRVASRGGFSGDVSGNGTLTYYTPYVRADVTGDWSAFTGQVNVVSDADGGDFRIASSYSWPGLPQAAVNLADRTYFYFSGIVNSGSGTTIEIGELSGSALSFLRGGPTGGRNFTYRIGSRNTNAIFAGKIGEQNTSTTTQIVKTGTGNWTLSGPSTWQGSTTVEAGTLTVSGSIICGSTVEVESGATLCLAGGTISADAINVAAGASLCGGGTLQGDLNNDGTLTVDSGTLAVTGDVVNNGTMRITNLSALTATGAFVNNGTLDLLTSTSSLPTNLENNGTVIDSSGLKLLSSSKAGAAFSLTIKGYSGHTYQLQRTSSTALSGWVDIGSAQSGTGGNLTFTDAVGATLARRFYRVKVTP